MNESSLLKAAFFCSFAGLVILFAVSVFSDIEPAKGNELGNLVGKRVRIVGEVINVRELNKSFIVQVSNKDIATVVVFKDGKMNFSNAKEVDIIGVVKEYRDNTEVIAEKVKIKK